MKNKKIKIDDFEYEIKKGHEIIGIVTESSKEFTLSFKKGKFPKVLKNIY